MTIRFIKSWNGYYEGQIVTSPNGRSEADLVTLGYAVTDLDGPGNSPLPVTASTNPLTGGVGNLKIGEKEVHIETGSIDGQAFRAVLAEAEATGRFINLHGDTIVLDQPVTINLAKVGIFGNGTHIDGSGLGGVAGVTLDYLYPDATGWQKSAAKVRSLHNLRISGSGKAVAGSVALAINGSQAPLGPRPSLYNIMAHGAEVGLQCNNRAFIGTLTNCDVYDAKIGMQQLAASDAGENMSWFGGVIHQCDLMLNFEDGSSEWFMYGVSFDYSSQLLVASGSPSRGHFFGCHIEPRGANAGDGLFIVDGSGSDAKAAIPGRDSFVDVGGNGSQIIFHGGWFDINNSGGLGPYAYDHLVNVRHKNSVVRFTDMSMQNMQNTANRFWVGAGQCFVKGADHKDLSVMPTRQSNQSHGNALSDGGVENATLGDYWYICKDTAAITSRVTGTNIAIARSTTQKYAGSSSMKVTKVSTGSGQCGVLVPITPGDRISAAGRAYRPASGGATGNIYADLRWVKVSGDDVNGVPVAVMVGANYSSATFSAATNAWNEFTCKTFDVGASGEPCAPAWATHARLAFNLDGTSAGDTYLDDLYISRW